MNIPSILRHWFTLAATAITAWLVGILLLSADDQAALAKAVSDLVGPLVIIGTLIVTALWRVALEWITQLFRRGAGEQEVEKSGGSGGTTPLILLACTAAALMGGLPSCTPPLMEAARAVPIRIGITTDHGTAAYSSKGGIEVAVDATSGK